ncbi:unnamed protein product [Calypogeia fissa]
MAGTVPQSPFPQAVSTVENAQLGGCSRKLWIANDVNLRGRASPGASCTCGHVHSLQTLIGLRRTGAVDARSSRSGRGLHRVGGLDWQWRRVIGKPSSPSNWARHVHSPLGLAAGGTLTGSNEEGVLGSGRQAPTVEGAGDEGDQEEEEEDEEDDEFDLQDSDVYDYEDDEIEGFLDDEEVELDGEERRQDLEDGHGGPNGAEFSSSSSTEIRESPSTRVAQLCARVQAADGFTVTTSDVADLYEFPIDKFQRLAIEGFLKGSSVVVCAPTSSGKTLIAEAAAASTLARQKRLFYTTPLKALSNQKLREFRKLFGEANVGLLTGDAAVNREAPIMVMTTEILRNMLYQSPGNSDAGSRLENVTTIVLDEVHYLSDISRGTVWEETVIYCPKGVQLICLSATVANPEDLAGWIAHVHGPTELVTGTRRPVPLSWHFSTRYDLLPLLNKQGTEMNWKLSLTNSSQRGSSIDSLEEENERGKGRRRSQFRKRLNSRSSRSNEGRGGRWRDGGWEEPDEERLSERDLQFLRQRQVPQVRDTLAQLTLRDMLPAIWFIFSRRGCDTAVKYLLETTLLAEEESRQVKEAIAKFKEEHPDSVRETAVEPLTRGVAAHHAGCLPTWKAFVEELFQLGLVKVVFATETLAAGINMPARTTVLSTLRKRGDAGHAPLSANAMLQMAGRAGRRGIDEQGHVVVVQTAFEGAEECCKILFAGVDPLVSQFTATYGMALNLLAGGKVSKTTNSPIGDLPAVPFGRTLDDAKDLIEQSFGNYVGSEVMHAARRQVAKLEDEVERHVQKTQAESSSMVLEQRLTKTELKEYLDLKELVKEQKAVLQQLVSDMEAAQAAAGASSGNISTSESGVPPEVLEAETLVAEKKKEISLLRKSLKRTLGYKEKHQLVVLQKSRLEKIARLQDKAAKISKRIKQMAPSGWKEFLQVVEVLKAVGAVNMETSELLPLGQTASAVRGENELWLALVFSNEAVVSLTSAQLAAVCGCLVSEGLKSRPEDGNSFLYEASTPVQDWVVAMETTAEWLLQLQNEHGVNIPCQIDVTFAGMVEAWAAGVTWKELMCDSGMDEGDVARVLRRSIDLLAQIPHMPHMNPDVAKLAAQTTKVMDRPPISELLG